MPENTNYKMRLRDVSKMNETEKELVKDVLSNGILNSKTDFNFEASKEQVNNIDNALVKDTDSPVEHLVKHSNKTVGTSPVEVDLECFNSEVTANLRAPQSCFVGNMKPPKKKLG